MERRRILAFGREQWLRKCRNNNDPWAESHLPNKVNILKSWEEVGIEKYSYLNKVVEGDIVERSKLFPWPMRPYDKYSLPSYVDKRLEKYLQFDWLERSFD